MFLFSRNLLLKIADLIEEKAEHLAMAKTLDNGNPFRKTRKMMVVHYSQSKNIYIIMDQSPFGLY